MMPKEKYERSNLWTVFDDLYDEAEKDYDRMPKEYRESITLEDHQENYIRQQALKER